METVAHEVRHLPAAEKQRGNQSRRGNDLGELAGEEHEKLAARVFYVIAGDQFRLAFRQIERYSLGLGDCRSEEQ